jgi:hypothetical protein
MRTAAYDGGETVKERRGAELAPGTAVSDPALTKLCGRPQSMPARPF